MLFAYLLAALASGSTMQPSGKWTVEFADNTCILSRQYGSETNPTFLNLKAPMLGTAYEIMIIVPKPEIGNDSTFDEGWIERPDGSKATAIFWASYRTVDDSRLTRFTVNSDDYVIGEDGERLIFHLNKRRTYDFAMPGFKKAQTVLDKCLSGLRESFGVGEVAIRQIATPAKPNRPVVQYFSTGDYPSDAVAKGEQGYVGVLFWVDTDGRAKECKVIESSHRRSLDERTCEVIRKRARFKPALDAQGNAIRSPYYQRIRWEMPG